MTRHPKLGAVERRAALSVNFLTSRSLRNLGRSGALDVLPLGRARSDYDSRILDRSPFPVS